GRERVVGGPLSNILMREGTARAGGARACRDLPASGLRRAAGLEAGTHTGRRTGEGVQDGRRSIQRRRLGQRWWCGRQAGHHLPKNETVRAEITGGMLMIRRGGFVRLRFVGVGGNVVVAVEVASVAVAKRQ